MGPLYRFSIRHPWLVIGAGIVSVLAAAPGMLRLELRTDGNALVPHHDPAVQQDNEVRAQFGIKDQLIVVVESAHPEGIYNLNTLRLVNQLTEQLQALPGFVRTDITSLAVEKSNRVYPGSLRSVPFLEDIIGPPPSSQPADVSSQTEELETSLKIPSRTPGRSKRPPTGDYPGGRRGKLSERKGLTPEQWETQVLDQLKRDLRVADVFIGTLVSKDERAAAILIGVEHEGNRQPIYDRVKAVVDGLPPHPEKVYVVGAPAAESLLGTHLLMDLRTLIPIAMAIMASVFLISFRTLWGVLLPLSEVGACLVFVFGLMGYSGVPVYLTIAVLPVILTFTGVTDEVHILSRYAQVARLRSGDSPKDITRSTMDDMWRPVVKTSITTTLGFLSFTLADLKPVQAFGVFTAIGIVFCMFWSLLVVPAALSVIRRPVRSVSYDAGEPSGFFAGLGRFAVRARWAVTVLVLALGIAAGWGARRVVVQDSWVDGFAKSSDFYQASKRVDDLFFGTHLLMIRVSEPTPIRGKIKRENLGERDVLLPGRVVDDPAKLAGMRFKLTPDGMDTFDVLSGEFEGLDTRIHLKAGVIPVNRSRDALILESRKAESYDYVMSPNPDGFLDSKRLLQMKDFEASLASQPTVGGVLGPYRYLTAIRKMMGLTPERIYDLPSDPRVVWTNFHNYGNVRGVHRLREILTPDYQSSLITVFLRDANFRATQKLLDHVRQYQAEHFAPLGLQVGFAGDIAVSQAMIRAIVHNQTTSVATALLGILIVTVALSRSLVWGVLCVLPAAFAVLVNFGIMGVGGIYLGVATSMFAGMTLGIGVDFAIHLLEHCRTAHRRGAPLREAMAESMAWSGKPIFVDALSVGAGFGVMLCSQVPANARLGTLAVASITTCFVMTVLFLPALLSLFAGRPSQPMASVEDPEDHVAVSTESGAAS